MKNIFIFSFILLTFYTASAQSGWIQMANFPGSPRGGAAYFSIPSEGKGYVVGGGGNAYFSDAWAYDTASNTWTEISNYPSGITSGMVGFSNDTAGYAGLGAGAGYQFSNSFYMYSPRSNAWTSIPNLPGPGRASGVAFTLSNYAYVGTGVNGFNSNTLSDFYRYSFATNTWDTIANYPGLGKMLDVAFSDGSYGYVGTGVLVRNSNYIPQKDFWKFDPSNGLKGTWTKIADFAGGTRGAAVAFSLSGNGYVGTGFIDSTETNLAGDFWKYDAVTDKWSSVAAYGGMARFNASSFALGYSAYVGLGFAGSSYDPIDLWRFRDAVNAGFAANTTTVCAGGTVNFTDTSTLIATSWAWSFPGGHPSTSTVQNPAITYNTVGAYDVTLTVSNNTDTFTITKAAYITVGSNTALDIEPKSVTICPGQPIALTVIGGGGKYTWSPSTSLNMTNGDTVIATPLNSIVFTVTSSSACVASGSDTITVISPTPLTFTPASPYVCPGQTITISVTGGGNYTWSPATGLNTVMGDSVIASIPPATDSIVYVVTSIGRCVDTGSVTLRSGGGSNPGIVSATNDTICQGSGAHLTLSGNSNSQMQWQSSTDGENFSDVPGAINTVLNTEALEQTTWYRAIVGSGACTATSDTLQIFVPPALTAYFMPQVNGLQVTFITSGNPNRYNWSFGDGSSSTSGSPVHTYNSAGAYNVCLTVVNGAGCISTSCQEVVVGGTNHCSAYFVLLADSTTPHHWFAVNESNGKAPITYNWQWGDGTSGIGDTASHKYASAGYYNVCLTITDDTACTSTYCDSSAYLYRMDGSNTIVSINVVNSVATGTPTVNAPINNLLVLPNPCTTCEVKGIDNENDMVATDMLGRRIDVSFSKASGGYSISFPTNQTGMFLLHNVKTGQVVKFVKLN